MSVVETFGIDHIFWPTHKKECLRLRDCEHLMYITLGADVPLIEEYIDGDETMPSLLCEWFGITIPPYISKKRK